MNNEINILDELNKGACMGKDAIHFVLDKVDNASLHDLLEQQYKKYDEISHKICKLYPEYSDKQPHETNAVNKVMTWYGIEMRTMIDDTSSKIAEIIMQGTNMGIIEGRKLLNHKDVDEKTKDLIQEFVNMQEEMIEKIKTYL